MRAVLFAVGMSLPIAAMATVAMERLQVAPSSRAVTSVGQAAPPRGAKGRVHHPLFIVKFELRRAPADRAPQIVMDDSGPQIVPPAVGDYPGATLRLSDRDPNTLVCYGWGCERRP